MGAIRSVQLKDNPLPPFLAVRHARRGGVLGYLVCYAVNGDGFGYVGAKGHGVFLPLLRYLLDPVGQLHGAALAVGTLKEDLDVAAFVVATPRLESFVALFGFEP